MKRPNGWDLKMLDPPQTEFSASRGGIKSHDTLSRKTFNTFTQLPSDILTCAAKT